MPYEESKFKKEIEKENVLNGPDTHTTFSGNHFDEAAPVHTGPAPRRFAEAFGKCFELAAFEVAEYDHTARSANLLEYARRAANWSDSKGAVSLNWAATISDFIQKDKLAGKLIRRETLAAQPPIVEAVTAAAARLTADPIGDFFRRLAFLAHNYPAAVAAGLAAADPEKAAQKLAELAADPGRATAYFNERQK